MEKGPDILAAKVVLLGAANVGKTCIVSRLTSNTFDPLQQNTVGSSLSQKDFTLKEGAISLRIWDTAGQERYHSIASMYYQSAHCIILVFAVTTEASFNEIDFWVNEIQKHYQTLPPLFLVGNMVDLADNRKVTTERAWDRARELGATYVETSALSGEGIDELFDSVASAALKAVTMGNVDENAKLLANSKAGKNKSCC